jgi:hypothetical protein
MEAIGAFDKSTMALILQDNDIGLRDQYYAVAGFTSRRDRGP